MEERIGSLREVLTLQEELEARDRRVAAAAPGVAVPATAPGDEARGLVSASAALPRAAAEARDPFASEPALPDIRALTWFPYVGGFLVCILCGVLFHLRAESERREERKRYKRFHQMHREVRSYLPDEL
jgi:hypothetical protein